MIKIEKVDIWGFEHAIRGMRNPLNSWSKSDSVFYVEGDEYIGDNDKDLMKRLSKAGQPHRKYLRQIMVSCDITAPLYWWKEFDTYKIGTTANSTSTMHKVHAKEFTLDDFSTEHLNDYSIEQLESLLGWFNMCRTNFVQDKDKDEWWQIIQLLPTSYNQKRTVTMNYENLLNMLEYRRHHKLDEWCQFCDWILTLPQSELLEVGCVHE